MTTVHTIDAAGKKLGRISTEAARVLMGKDKATYERNIIPDIKVTIMNASKADFGAKKTEEKIYRTYSGYPGGLKTKTLGQVAEKKGFGEVFKDAVYGMLPGNKLRPRMMKNLTVTE